MERWLEGLALMKKITCNTHFVVRTSPYLDLLGVFRGVSWENHRSKTEKDSLLSKKFLTSLNAKRV